MSDICGTDPKLGSGRGATIDGSRGFQPTVMVTTNLFRRGATVDGVAARGVAPGFMRRSATRFIVGAAIRGLKPTATIRQSLRDEEAMSMADDERAGRMEMNLERDYWPLNTALYVIDFKGTHPRFAAYFMKNALRDYQSDKAAIPGVDRNVVHGFQVRVPDKDTQERIASTLTAYASPATNPPASSTACRRGGSVVL